MPIHQVAREIRFWHFVLDRTACWEWQGGKSEDGYGLFSAEDCSKAHRYSFELHYGPIPSGFEIDHLCRNRSCVNPFHLEAVSHQENMRRMPPRTRKNECMRGHPYTPENTGRHKTGRYCKTCRKVTEARRARQAWRAKCQSA